MLMLGLYTLLFGLFVCVMNLRIIILNLTGRERSVDLELFLSVIFLIWYCVYLVMSAVAT